MAENKKSFVLYSDIITTVKKLSLEKIGILFTTILEYVNDEDPKVDDDMVDLVFEPIKQQLKRDLVKYEKRADRSRENGQLGGRPKNPEKPSGLQGNPKEPRKPDSVNDNVSVTVNDNDINNTITDSKKSVDVFNNFWDFYKYKLDRKKCIRTFKKISEKNINKIRDHLPNYLACTFVPGRPKLYPTAKIRKHPLTYLNGECWNDEPLLRPKEESKVYIPPKTFEEQRAEVTGTRSGSNSLKELMKK